MKRPWERDRGLSHIPLGWRRTAYMMLAVAGEHRLHAGVAVRWSDVPHPYCPALVFVEQRYLQGLLPRKRERVQFIGRALIDRIALRALSTCMACGTVTTPPAHVALEASGGTYIALLCQECEDAAAANGGEFWYAIGRLDPLQQEREQAPGLPFDGDDEPEENWPGDDEEGGWYGDG